MCCHAVPRRVRREVETELLGIWAQPDKQGALIQLAASTRQIWPTLPRSGTKLSRRGRQNLDLLRFDPRPCIAASARPIPSRVVFCLVRQRTDQIDVFTRRVELSDYRLGHYPGHYPQKSSGGIDPAALQEGAWLKHTRGLNQPPRVV